MKRLLRIVQSALAARTFHAATLSDVPLPIKPIQLAGN